ncbi:MAG: tetratricopeptide repeat protein [Deltaproteobacteria bacterium]|nr:tetratricopeptide repeat protein [Deltaproteobacteria bacterium]
MQDQPFVTPTVARIYLDQGKLDQAEQVFKKLLEAHPDDDDLKEGLAEIARRRSTEQRENTQDDGVQVEVDGSSLRCRWSTSPSGRHRAELVAGQPGDLVLRVVGFPHTPDSAPDDTALTEQQGMLTVDAPDALMAAASVGLFTKDGQFVSIAHSKIVQLK